MKGAIIGWTYAAIALATFAVSASDPEKACWARQWEGSVLIWQPELCGVYDRTIDGLTAGAFWPFYWAWDFVETIRSGGKP